MHRRCRVFAVSLLVWAGCDGGDSDTGATAGSGSTTVSSGSGTSSTATTTGGQGSGTGPGGGPQCMSSADCEAAAYCDFGDNSCGTSGVPGTCAERPTGCSEERPVCGCDDAVYPSECAAADAGIDLAFAGACTPPNGAFGCGFSYCIGGMEFCRQDGGAMPTFSCMELPPVCQPAECACILDCCGCEGPNCCEQFCQVNDGDLTVTCPG